ncbi:type II/IV secretion system protein [Candidatus Kaiserbacteria bacterium]|nr:type II/IV secretion system protein [Candidatus Kaiserbacteria bacterium]
MAIFDESEQKERVAELYQQEEEDLARVLSGKYGVKYIDLSQTSINTDALRLVKEEDARAYEVAAFHKIAKRISLAVRAPNKKEIQVVTQNLEKLGYEVDVFMVSRASLERAWERYKDLSFSTESKAGILDISGEEIVALIQKLKSIPDVKVYIEDVMKLKKAYRISRILEAVLAGAMGLGASDVHVEPEETYVRLRYRLDGVLTDVLSFDIETYGLLLSRIKLISGLKLNIHNAAQDGRFSVAINENDTEIRTSILPGAYGESIVMRILDPRTIAVPLEELGIPANLRKILEHEIGRPNGMILNTGPTGSGKTTTLYAFLRKIHNPEVKIITIENPIEYHLPGIVQTQTEGEKYTFASGLRSTLRQDPDVIMVGEIRDKEVASTAINAALTGHLVFSTLHTNNAAGTFPRLIDLGVNPKVIGSAVNVVMAQRLVRKLKDEYKKEVVLEGKDKEIVDKILSTIHDKSLIPEDTTKIFEATENSPIAYKGRLGIFEAIIVNEEIERLIAENPSEREINRVAKKQGILTMAQDGVLKALEGVTSLSELRRVIDLEGNVDL